MKKLIPCFLLLCAWSAQAQSFEGTLKWSMKMEITDPALKAKMEESAKRMNDPANQAKMKEMQAKMNDPQMKAAMDANPQMKAQMENAMKMMAGGDMSSMMPKGFIIELKDGNALTKMEGGMMDFEVLYLKDKDKSYHVDRKNKTFSVVDNTKSTSSAEKTPPKVTKTSETAKVLNYTCTKYLVEYTEAGHTINQQIWSTTEIKDIDLKGMSKYKSGSRNQSIYFEGMEGVPLRSLMITPQGNITVEVTEIKRGGVSASDFEIPADFKETQGMFGKY